MVHVLEGPSHSILSVLKTLSEHPHFSSQPSEDESLVANLQQGRIVFNVEDRPERFYPEWFGALYYCNRFHVAL